MMQDYGLQRFSPIFLAMMALWACSKSPDGSQSGTSSVMAGTSVEAPGSLAVSKDRAASACPPTGLWAVCSVERRLKQSGFVAQKNDSAMKPRTGFSIPPVAYTLNKSRLELYLYKDAAAAQTDVAGIDTVRVAPVFIRTGNLVALLFTDDATQAERLSLALTAGAPQGSR